MDNVMQNDHQHDNAESSKTARSSLIDDFMTATASLLPIRDTNRDHHIDKFFQDSDNDKDFSVQLARGGGNFRNAIDRMWRQQQKEMQRQEKEWKKLEKWAEEQLKQV